MDNSLDNLLGDSNSGAHAARSPLKILNHLDQIGYKENIAIMLGLHNIHSKTDIFSANYQLLKDHKERKLTTTIFIEALSYNLAKQGNKSITPARVRDLLSRFSSVDHLEFHPYDNCNEACYMCTYSSSHLIPEAPTKRFPYSHLSKLALLNPKSLIIVGGGEPTLYRYGEYKFDSLIRSIRLSIPAIPLALVTNGTFNPSGGWTKEFGWLRISLDAATPETYLKIKGKPFFDRVLDNFIDYLRSDIPRIGIGFLYSKLNIEEYVECAHLIYKLVMDKAPDKLYKVDIQYRPLRNDNPDAPFLEALEEQDITTTVDRINKLSSISEDFEAFLRNQTNITSLLGSNNLRGFRRCYYSEIFKIVRANGDIRPCCVRIDDPDLYIGNILDNSLEEIGINTLYIACKGNIYCSPKYCKLSVINHIAEAGVNQEVLPSTSKDILNDPMF